MAFTILIPGHNSIPQARELLEKVDLEFVNVKSVPELIPEPVAD